jgi:putative NADPH-quinone reductase
MRVLTVFAHHGSGSFCHAVSERFDAGLRDAGHANDIVDLYAIDFDPDATLVDEFALHYPGIKRVERECFYAVHDGDTAKLQRYLDRASALGREF